MINHYHYEGQLRSYLLQFCQIFAGLKVRTGKGECGDREFISVPISVGSKDRVVAAIQTGNSQNRPFALPSMSASISNISISPQRKGVGIVDKRVVLPQGGVYPNDLRTLVRVMPIPYVMSTELALYASNMDQMHQMLEQILMLFDPAIQIQTSDAAFDWAKIASVELTGINNEENYPPGGDRRIIMWTLNFETAIYISAPVDIKDEIVRKIVITIGDLDNFAINEYDDQGNLVPFADGSEFAKMIIE